MLSAFARLPACSSEATRHECTFPLNYFVFDTMRSDHRPCLFPETYPSACARGYVMAMQELISIDRKTARLRIERACSGCTVFLQVSKVTHVASLSSDLIKK
jgi:hypothetical protein